MGAQCTGECCEAFAITCGKTLDAIDFYLRSVAEDGAFIADMLIPLYALVAGTTMPSGELVTPEHAKGGAIGWVFTCKHFDREQRLCSVYADRPLMCRDFPYGKPCEHHERCGWDKGRAGKHPLRVVKYEDTRLDSGRMHRRVHLAMIKEFEVAAR